MRDVKHVGTSTRILLGGGIGAGKSVASRRLAIHGVRIVEADHLGHAVLEAGAEAFEAVAERWPTVVSGARIDRLALAAIVFRDPDQLEELERMTHPAIIDRIVEIASASRHLAVEIPLILHVPGEWANVFVDATEGVRLARAIARGATEHDVRSRMANQPERADWLAWADRVIDNEGSVDDLERQIDALWDELGAEHRRPQA